MATIEEWKEWVHYDPETGFFTKRKGPKAGQRAEIKMQPSPRKFYYEIRIGDRARMYAQRLAFVLMGEPLPAEVDHIDQDSLNNRWANLRGVNHRANCMNQKMNARNTSGHMGVHWDKSRNKWCASIKVKQKKIALGRFNDIADAITARQKAEKQYGFHPNHGRTPGQ